MAISIHTSLCLGSLFLWLPKELDVARMTVRILAMFLEGAFVKKLEAKGTVEVFRMPLLTHGSDALT